MSYYPSNQEAHPDYSDPYADEIAKKRHGAKQPAMAEEIKAEISFKNGNVRTENFRYVCHVCCVKKMTTPMDYVSPGWASVCPECVNEIYNFKRQSR